MLTFSFLISHKISTCCPVSRWEARFKNAEGQADRPNPLSLGQRSSTVLISISDVSVRWDRTFVGDLHEPGALALVEAPRARDRPIDAIEHTFLCFAVRAIFGVDFRVPQPHRNLVERKRLQPQCHRAAGADRGERS